MQYINAHDFNVTLMKKYIKRIVRYLRGINDNSVKFTQNVDLFKNGEDIKYKAHAN